MKITDKTLYSWCDGVTDFESLNISNLLLDIIRIRDNKIKQISCLDKLNNLKELDLEHNQILEISGLDNLVNLEKLFLCYNEIKQLKGLDNTTKLNDLQIIYNKITKIEGLDNLTNLEILTLCFNQITQIEGLNNLINLKILTISNNNITKIEGLDNLTNLNILGLSANKITSIRGLQNLTKLKRLNLCFNQITEINGLDNLVNLNTILLQNNQITEIKGLDNLINLEELYLDNNKITELPLSLCYLKNIKKFTYYNNPIKYIPLPVKRWLKRNKTYVIDNTNTNVNIDFQNSLDNILRDNDIMNLDQVKNEINNNNTLTLQTKRKILNYCDDNTHHAIFLITFSDLLVYVWSRISKSKNMTEICNVLNHEINDEACISVTGRLTRLLKSLNGFYDDISLLNNKRKLVNNNN